MRPDEAMLDAVARGQARRSPHRPDLQLLGQGPLRPLAFPELFDGIVISGEVGIRKPVPGSTRWARRRSGCAPAECVFVDDLPPNLKPAAELGMATVHHVSADETIAQLEEILEVSLRPRSPR